MKTKLTLEITKKIKQKEIILQHDSTVEALNAILRSLFPRSDPASGSNLYYYASYVQSEYWNCGDVMLRSEVEFMRVSDLIEQTNYNYEVWLT